MDLNGLTLINGLPRELIEDRLKEAKIEYVLSEDKNKPFFRSSTIDLARMYPSFSNNKQLTSAHKDRIIELLDFPHFFIINSYFYRAWYKIEHNFDISKLDGKITFYNGLLVESTRIIL